MDLRAFQTHLPVKETLFDSEANYTEAIQACYRHSGEKGTPAGHPESCAVAPFLGGFDGLYVQHDPNLSSEHLDQDRYSLAVGHAFKYAGIGGENALHDVNFVTCGKPRFGIERDQTALILR